MCRFRVLLFVWSVGVLCVEFEVCGVFVCSVQRQRQRDWYLHLGSYWMSTFGVGSEFLHFLFAVSAEQVVSCVCRILSSFTLISSLSSSVLHGKTA